MNWLRQILSRIRERLRPLQDRVVTWSRWAGTLLVRMIRFIGSILRIIGRSLSRFFLWLFRHVHNGLRTAWSAVSNYVRSNMRRFLEIALRITQFTIVGCIVALGMWATSLVLDIETTIIIFATLGIAFLLTWALYSGRLKAVTGPVQRTSSRAKGVVGKLLPKRLLPSPERDEEDDVRRFREEDKSFELGGIYLNPILVAVLRPVLSITAGILTALALLAFDRIIMGANLLGPVTTSILAALLSVLYGLDDYEKPADASSAGTEDQKELRHLNVPVAHATIVTFLGMRIPVYLLEGDYPWSGKKLFFGRYTGQVPGLDPAIFPHAKDGFIFVGDYVIQIWDNSTQKGVIGLSNVARDSSTVKANLTLTIQVLNLRKWVDTSDPTLAVAERARATFRTAISFFTGIDCASVKTVLGRLMLGETIITSFLREPVGPSPQFSIVQDSSGVHLLTEAYLEHDVPAAKRKFSTMLKRIKPAMRSKILDENGKPIIETRSIDNHMFKVLKGVGAKLLEVSVSDVTLSEIVEESANKAASETFQLDAQVKSARAIREARKILTPTKKEADQPAYELATVLAAAQDSKDDRVRVIHISGAKGNPISQAAAVLGASKNGDN